MADDALSYSDLIKPDNAIEDAIRELERLGTSYEALTSQVKKAATEIQNTLRSATGTTDAGRAAIEQAVADANALYEAHKSLTRQTTEVGKAEEYFARKSAEVSKESRNIYSQNNAAAGSYNRLNAELQEMIEHYKSLSETEREYTSYGIDLASNILNLEKKIQSINNTIKVGTSDIDVVYDSYNGLKLRLKELTDAYKALDAVARERGIGRQYLRDIQDLYKQISDIDNALKDTTATVTPASGSIDEMRQRVAELTKQYNALSDADRQWIGIGGALAQQIQDLNNRIKAATDNLKAEGAASSQVMTLQDKLNDTMAKYQQIMSSIDPHDKDKLSTADVVTKDTGALNAYNKAIKEQIKIKQAEAAAAAAADGSYRQQSYTYQALVLKIKNMAVVDEESKRIKAELVVQARLLREELKKQEQELGDYHRSVGNYGLAWNGLNHEINQLIRELPNAGISARTFFMAISNNVPMFVEQLQNARRKYKDLIAAGEEAEPVYKQIVKGLLSWQTALVLVLTVLNVWGEDIVDWIMTLIRGEKQVQSFDDALHEVADELQEMVKQSGNVIVSFKNLAWEWKQLKSTAEKVQWIKDNQEEFKKLDIEVRNVNGAENIFNKNTESVLKALMLRAKAAAASQLAIKRYGEALEQQTQAETRQKAPTWWDKARGWARSLGGAPSGSGISNEEWRRRVTNQIAANEAADYAREANRLEQEAEQFNTIQQNLLAEASELLKSIGVEEYHKHDRTRTGRGHDRDNDLHKRYLDIQKKYEASITALERDESKKRRKEALDESAAKIRALEETYRQNEKILAGQDKRYTKLSEEQREMVKQMQEWITATITNYQEDLKYKLDQIDKDRQLSELSIARETLNLKLQGLKKGSAEELALRLQLLKNERNAELIENSKLYEKERQSEIDIINKYNTEIETLEREHRIKMLEAAKENYELQLTTLRENSEEEYAIKVAQLDLDEQIALEQNRLRADSLKTDENLIKQSYSKRRKLLWGTYIMNMFDEQQEAAEAEFNAKRHSENAITRFSLKQEKKRWKKQIKLAEAGALDWGEAQFRIARAELKRINNELCDTNFIGQVGDKGIGGALLSAIGFDDKQIEAMSEFADIVIEQIERIVDAEVEAAEKAVEAAEKRVSAAQSAYEAEIEARNNGYANSVATAKKELDQERKNQREKQKILEQAQKRQEAINSLTQASSLITASANLWSAFSGVGPAGPFLAAAAIAAMWASFIYSKNKAKQLTSQADTYGEGGLEFLEGGSHASGNDIDLQTRNSRGRNMRAEGGEALAIINRRKTHKYRKMLPDIIDSLNKGIFEDKYLRAFDNNGSLNLAINNNSTAIDLSRVEDDVANIRKANETKYYTLSNGNVVIQTKNIKRIIKN